MNTLRTVATWALAHRTAALALAVTAVAAAMLAGELRANSTALADPPQPNPGCGWASDVRWEPCATNPPIPGQNGWTPIDGVPGTFGPHGYTPIQN